MSLHYGDKIYTYKDIEEAKKLIGKLVICSEQLRDIKEIPDCLEKVVLKDVSLGRFFTHETSYQFIREVIDEPKYRPFNSVDELIEYWDKNYCTTTRPKGTMPLIWVKPKNSDGSMKEAILITEFWSDGIVTTFCEHVISFKDLFDNWVFLNGSPIGAKE